MEAEKYHNLPSINGKTRKTDGVRLTQSRKAQEPGVLIAKSR